MTPLQYLLLVGNTIYCVDFEGTTKLLCVAPSREDAEFVITGLAEYHQVQAKVSNLQTIIGCVLPELAAAQTGCTCGWGGVHDPDNPRCELNAGGGGSDD